MNEGDWKQDELDLLRRLWAEGVKTAELSARLHRTKNSVIGKAHRLGLLARPSPILPRRDGQPSRRRVAKPAAPKPAPKVAVAPSAAPIPRKTHPARAVVAAPAPQPAPVAPSPPVAAPTACTTPPEFVYAEGGRGCASVVRPWRIGDLPGANTCGKPRRDARCPYCARCAAVFLRPALDRRPSGATEGASWG